MRTPPANYLKSVTAILVLAVAIACPEARSQTFDLDYAATLDTYDSLLCGPLGGTVEYALETASGTGAFPRATGRQSFYYEAGRAYGMRHADGALIQEGRTLVTIDDDAGRVVVDTAAPALPVPDLAVSAELAELFFGRAARAPESAPGKRTYHVALEGLGGYERAHLTYDTARGYFDAVRLEYAEPQGDVTAVRMTVALVPGATNAGPALADVLDGRRLRGRYSAYELFGL